MVGGLLERKVSQTGGIGRSEWRFAEKWRFWRFFGPVESMRYGGDFANRGVGGKAGEVCEAVNSP